MAFFNVRTAMLSGYFAACRVWNLLELLPGKHFFSQPNDDFQPNLQSAPRPL